MYVQFYDSSDHAAAQEYLLGKGFSVAGGLGPLEILTDMVLDYVKDMLMAICPKKPVDVDSHPSSFWKEMERLNPSECFFRCVD